MLLMTVAVYCINNMNIDTLDTSTGTAEPSTAISIFYLPFLIYILALGCLVSAKLVALWLLCEKKWFGLPHLASVARSLVI